jgi:hypothetical protein
VGTRRSLLKEREMKKEQEKKKRTIIERKRPIIDRKRTIIERNDKITDFDKREKCTYLSPCMDMDGGAAFVSNGNKNE